MASYSGFIRNTLQKNLPSLSVMRLNNIVDTYVRNPEHFQVELTDDTFFELLKKVPLDVLDKHSLQCWRNPNPVELNKRPYPVRREDILNGDALCPPSSKHIGIQLLQMAGYLPMLVDVKVPKHFSVTFVGK
jgi:hypothetical protein